MTPIQNSEVAAKFESYPAHIKDKLRFLRQLILDTASEMEEIDTLEETLKWGEPSYLTKSGSTIRINWKASQPDHYAMYFHCKTKLVDTFRELYRDQFVFQGNRAIVFKIEEKISVEPLKHCVSLSLNYHRVKHLPMLGA